MAEKATIMKVNHVIAMGGGTTVYQVRADVTITKPGGQQYTVVEATVPDFSTDPLVWKQALKTVTIGYAMAKYGLTVDQVMFPDFTVL